MGDPSDLERSLLDDLAWPKHASINEYVLPVRMRVSRSALLVQPIVVDVSAPRATRLPADACVALGASLIVEGAGRSVAACFGPSFRQWPIMRCRRFAPQVAEMMKQKAAFSWPAFPSDIAAALSGITFAPSAVKMLPPRMKKRAR